MRRRQCISYRTCTGRHQIFTLQIAQGAPTCWFSEARLEAGEGVREAGGHAERAHAPAITLLALERTIQQRRDAAPGSLTEALRCKEICCRLG